jgi:hypothetical protein
MVVPVDHGRGILNPKILQVTLRKTIIQHPGNGAMLEVVPSEVFDIRRRED